MIFFIALSLAMDAFAVSISVSPKKLNSPLKYGVYFGFFQFIMPIIGYVLSEIFNEYIINYGSIIASLLLFAIGIKMIFESLHEEESSTDNILLLALLTSIDALAVGVTFSLLNTPIISSSIIIGLVSFVLSYIGAYVGQKLCFLEGKAEIFGGVVLILIGLKNLL